MLKKKKRGKLKMKMIMITELMIRKMVPMPSTIVLMIAIFKLVQISKKKKQLQNNN